MTFDLSIFANMHHKLFTIVTYLEQAAFISIHYP